MKKLLLGFTVILILAIGGAFYGGIKYSGAKRSGAGGDFQNFRSLSPGQRQTLGQNQGSGQRNGTGFAGGEIINKDEKSITVKLLDGGSKIIFFSDSTQILKSVDGSLGDLEVGKQVVVNGRQNQDGSITAQSIQLRSLGEQPQNLDPVK